MTDVLADYKLEYEDVPRKKYQIIKKGHNKMSKEVKQAKTRKVYQKTRGEHYKDIVITILVTGIVAFVAGASYQNGQNQALQSAIDAVAPAVEASPSK